MKHLIVGTAGHIDHGKSALVKALTGIDPDRLKEEKERGLTIDLGFAHMELPDGTPVSFVDVPGHERFVKNMLAGAAGMDIVILVIDATESVMPQTREHFDIMRLLEISRGIIAITKIDLVDNEMIEIVEAEIEDLTKDTFLESAPVVRVSSKTGEGLDEIRKLIGDAVEQQKQKDEQGLFRFPIDRVFTMKGFGTVVTGTVFSGILSEDEQVQVLPSGLSSRARQLQSHNRKQEKISAGMRAALNLAGVAVEELKRGDTIVRPGTAAVTDIFDARVKLLSSAPRKLSRTSIIKVYAATNQQVARMLLYGQPELKPGEESYAQFRCQNPICMFRGDHFVLRAGSPEITIGGGIVLDVMPQRTRLKKREKKDWLKKLHSASPAETALAFLSKEEAAIALGELAVRLGETHKAVHDLVSKYAENGKVLSFSAGDEMLLIARSRFDLIKERALKELTGFFKAQPHRLFMPREQLRNRLGDNFDVQLFERILEGLVQEKKLEISREGISLAGRSAGLTEAQKTIKQRAEKLYRDTGYAPPTITQAEEQLGDPKAAKQMISLLIEEGTLQRISPALAYHKEFLESASAKIKEHFQANERLTVGDLKTVLGVSRKHAVPLLEYFDKIGLTVRVGDYRIAKKQVKE